MLFSKIERRTLTDFGFMLSVDVSPTCSSYEFIVKLQIS